MVGGSLRVLRLLQNGLRDIAEILLKVALNTKNQINHCKRYYEFTNKDINVNCVKITVRTVILDKELLVTKTFLNQEFLVKTLNSCLTMMAYLCHMTRYMLRLS